MEANHASLQDKFEKLETELKDEIIQAQRNTVGQIASMLGLPDPTKQKGPLEEAIPIYDLPYQSVRMGSFARGPFEGDALKAQVQFNTGTSASAPLNIGVGQEMETEVPNFDEIEDKAKAEKLESRCEKLEEMIKSLQGATICGGIDARELSLVDDLVIPPKFKTPEFEKFDGTTCPSSHLTMYCRKMSLYLDNEKLLIHCFQDSLGGSAARWYTQLSRVYIKTWRDLSKAFLDQYKHITDMVPGRTQLQTMEQRPGESFRQYA